MAIATAKRVSLRGRTEVLPSELNQWLESGVDLLLIDVREEAEARVAPFPGARVIPLGEIVTRRGELTSSRPVVLVCKSGKRSLKAITLLNEAGYRGQLINLTGGVLAWSAGGH